MSYEEWKTFNGFTYKEWRNEEGLMHREDGPASICYNEDGSLKWESFYFHSRMHRELGPANILYYPDGSIEVAQYWLFGSLHRGDGPAVIYYHPGGSIRDEEFSVHGVFLAYREKGFWMLWSSLTEDERKSTNILKCLARYS
jgi:hypothetical protein